jgi:GxxExxY protein
MAYNPSRNGYNFGRLSYDTIGACLEVQRELGLHCMEVDYQRALELALGKRGLEYMREVEIPILFEDRIITRRRVDFLVSSGDSQLILETKARTTILPEDVEQCLLYLQKGNYPLRLLVNFGEKPLGIRRYVSYPSVNAWACLWRYQSRSSTGIRDVRPTDKGPAGRTRQRLHVQRTRP